MRYRLLTILLLVSFSAFAQDVIPKRPREKALVFDFTEKTLNNNEIRSLENKLESYHDSTSTQIAVVFINSLQGYEVVDFAQRTAQEWGVGQSDKDNGIMILVAINDRKAAIVTGYGMEGLITDAATFTIREDYMNPNFRNGDYYRGIDEATDVLMKLASGEFTSDQVSRGRTSSGNGKGLPFGLIFIIIFFIIPALFGRKRGRNSMGRRSFPWWIFLLGSGSGRGRNDWDNFRGGGGGFGGGGGGFGGFGGGSFGGGGSGGSW